MPPRKIRSHLVAALAAAIATGLLAVPPAIAHHPGQRAAVATVPEDRPGRGLVYEGLEPGRGLCAGMLQVRGAPEDTCTHGPDPAPAGIEVTKRRAVKELAGSEPASGSGDRTSSSPGAAPSILCAGNGSDGNRVVAIYARASNVADRYSQIAPLIRGWAAEASGVFDTSAAKTGDSRRIRFQTSAPPGCQLTVLDVTLSSAGDDSFANTINELRAKGFTRSDRKYLVWMDANRICGQAQVIGDDSASAGNANNGRTGVSGLIARVDNGCWGRLSSGISIEAHELSHNLGGVQLSAPNTSGGWHCTDEADTLCYSDSPYYPAMKARCPAEQEKLLDCNGDDYFNTRPRSGSYLATHWNTASSSFLHGGPAQQPSNDHFGAAIALGAHAKRTDDRTTGATKQSGEPWHAGNAGGASIWYRWRASSSRRVTITTAGSTFDTTLAAYRGGSLGSLKRVAANDDAGGPTSTIDFIAAAGETYRIAVDGRNSGSGAARGVVAIELSLGKTTKTKTKTKTKKKKKKSCKRKLRKLRKQVKRSTGARRTKLLRRVTRLKRSKSCKAGKRGSKKRRR